MVHNDYTYELAPKFEFFSDRFELTSYGGLPQGLSQEEFFEGISIPRSKELMRVFRDMELVEQLGSGIPRILQSYGRECFHFSDNYIRMSFPSFALIKETVGETVGETAMKIINLIVQNPYLTREELAEQVGMSVRGIEYNIKKLKSLGILSRKGSSKSGKWVVLSNDSKIEHEYIEILTSASIITPLSLSFRGGDGHEGNFNYSNKCSALLRNHQITSMPILRL